MTGFSSVLESWLRSWVQLPPGPLFIYEGNTALS
jgi:hypothetical protein